MKKQRANQSQTRGLYHASAVGPRMRKHRYLAEVTRFLKPAILTALLQAAIYIYVMSRGARSDWQNIGAAVFVIALVPFATAAVLTAFRRNEAPIATAAIVSIGVFSMAVSVLSALRIPISYVGLLWCLPVTVTLAIYGNLRFSRLTNTGNVALAKFPDAERVADELGGVALLRSPSASLAGVEVLLIDPVFHHSEAWSPLLARCYLEGIEITPWTRYAEVRFGRLDVNSFDVSHLVYTPSQLIYARTKRFFDIAFIVLTLPLTLLLGLLVAAYIFLRDGGPVIFVQIRRGYGNRRFRMYKFRTMYKKSENGATTRNDKRIIPGCRIIRKFRLDELPQLFNILRGDMSLIGPRPVAEYVARNTEAIEPKYQLRSLVLPGLSGWAQVTSGYAENAHQEIDKLSYDLYYIKHLSFDLDLLIIFKTIRTVISGYGAR